MQQDPRLAVLVTIAFFVLVGYLATVLRKTRSLARILIAVALLLGALPPILYALLSV